MCSKNTKNNKIQIQIQIQTQDSTTFADLPHKPINTTGLMRRQPRTNLLREVMRPIRKPGIFTAGYNNDGNVCE